jgi:hypothetical protein
MTGRDGGPAVRSGLRNAIGCITLPFLLLAGVCLAWGARVTWSDGALLRKGVTVTGQVTELRHVFGQRTVHGAGKTRTRVTATGRIRRRTDMGPTPLSPVVAFTTRDGERRTAIGSVNRAPPAYEVGDEAEVVYDPADPRRADVRSELEGWWLRCAMWTASALTLLAFAAVPVALLAYQPRPSG